MIPALLITACSGSKNLNHTSNDEIVSFAIIQINDFYEIAPLENGKIGGAARIASLRKKVLKDFPNTYTVLAGDFLSPSLLGTLKWEGERIRGKQMVEALNLLGLDLATFGNHEFDIDMASLQKRLNESKFDWVSSNVLQVNNGQKAPFTIQQNGNTRSIPKNKIIRFSNAKGKTIRIGFVAPCLPANKTDFVYYEDIYTSTEQQLKIIKDSVDFIISLSHLNKEDDLAMAKKYPEINLILGGHEHENMKYEIGKR
ncbi:MAG: metallophosphoesterase [Saprospiraceae bacterium]|nr:metallophosphoesterase [Saprospiraceae bacterium]